MERIIRSGSYVIRDGNIITMDEETKATDVGVRRRMSAGFASRLVHTFRVSTIKMLWSL